MKNFRLIISKPQDAFYNMALDEALFLSYLKTGVPFFRIYYWDSPSFSIGISQDVDCEIELNKCAKDKVNLVRRMTGGGILFHHKEITYSFGCSKSGVGEPSNILVSYKNICRFLIEFYKSLGLNAQYAKDLENFEDYKSPHPICTSSYEKYDIVINGKKIGGNAQKRSREFIFQHGIIPFCVDFEFMSKYLKNFEQQKVKGSTTYLNNELKQLLYLKDLEDKLINSFSQCFGVEFTKSELTEEEVVVCKKLIANKYKHVNKTQVAE